MKKLSLIAAALALSASGALAQTTLTDDFIVSVAFTSSCKISQNADDLAFTHTAFGAAQSQSTAVKFDCTRGLAPKFKFDSPDATQTGSPEAITGQPITGEGVIKGLRYRLTGATSKVGGDPATAGAAGAVGTEGTADVYTVAITATIPANQAGDDSGAPSQTRTLTITY